ncbi:uncharacterized protein LOC108605467 [Drosophila busckii]|uniref:uncharacterized protein LOC108605467 n=1 Tax=Drosophila busckii TaxID=30019 RepID=UPI00083ED021|nr:uncharacterized protein LOC108605467 [Drosophila busckii]
MLHSFKHPNIHIVIEYQHKVCFIETSPFSNYEMIMELAANYFRIPPRQRIGLTLSNGQGHMLLDYQLDGFLILFPRPDAVFHMRLDWQKLRRALHQPLHESRPGTPIPRARSRSVDHSGEDSENDADATPVFRQNCFIGELPLRAAAAPLQRSRSRLRQRSRTQPVRMLSSSEDDDESSSSSSSSSSSTLTPTPRRRNNKRPPERKSPSPKPNRSLRL